MNKNEFVASVAEKAGIAKKDAAAVIDATIETITSALSNGDSVRFLGFGTFATKVRPARKSRNPRTGEFKEIPAVTVPIFKPSNNLKESIK